MTTVPTPCHSVDVKKKVCELLVKFLLQEITGAYKKVSESCNFVSLVMTEAYKNQKFQLSY